MARGGLNPGYNKLGFVLRQIILWRLFTRLIWLTLFMTCSVTYSCHRIPIWNLWVMVYKYVLTLLVLQIGRAKMNEIQSMFNILLHLFCYYSQAKNSWHGEFFQR